jgi:hypothetical protein
MSTGKGERLVCNDARAGEQRDKCGGATVPVAKVKVQLGRKFVASALAAGGGSLRLRLCL